MIGSRLGKSISLLILILASFSWAQNNNVEPLIIIPDLQKHEKPLFVSSLTVETNLIGSLLETDYTLVLKNPNKRDLTADITLPLGQHQSVYSYSLEVKGQMLPAVAVEKQKARQVFEDIVNRRVDPALLEKEAGNKYRLKVYPVPRGATRKVIIRTTERLGSKWDQKLLPAFAQKEKGWLNLIVNVHGQKGCPQVLQDKQPQEMRTDPYGRCFLERKIDQANFTSSWTWNSGSFQPLENKTTYFAEGNQVWYHKSQEYGLLKPAPRPMQLHIIWDVSASHKMDPEKIFSALADWSPNAEVHVSLLGLTLRDRGKWKLSEYRKGPLDADHIQDGEADFSLLKSENFKTQHVLFISDGEDYLERLPNIDNSKHSFFLISEKVNSLSEYLQQTGMGKALFWQEGHSFSTTWNNAFRGGIALNKSGVEEYRSYGKNSIELWGQMPLAEFDTTGKVPGLEGIRREWAFAKIRMLEIQAEKHKQDILNIAQKYGLISRFTSLLVLESVQDYVQYEIEPPAFWKDSWQKAMQQKRRQESRLQAQQQKATYENLKKQIEVRENWWLMNLPWNVQLQVNGQDSLIYGQKQKVDFTIKDASGNDLAQKYKDGLKLLWNGQNMSYSQWDAKVLQPKDPEAKYTLEVSHKDFRFKYGDTLGVKVNPPGVLLLKFEDQGQWKTVINSIMALKNEKTKLRIKHYGASLGEKYTWVLKSNLRRNSKCRLYPSGETAELQCFDTKENVSIYVKASKGASISFPITVFTPTAYQLKKKNRRVYGKRKAKAEAAFDEGVVGGGSGGIGIGGLSGAMALEEEASELRREAAPLFKKDSPGSNGNSIAMKLQTWKGKGPWMDLFANAQSQFDIYVMAKEKYRDNAVFYVDAAAAMWSPEDPTGFSRYLTLQILSNLGERWGENSEIMKVYAYALMDYKEYAQAVRILELITRLRPEEPQSWRDLALGYQANGQYELAARTFMKVIEGTWDSRFADIQLIVLNELNNLLYFHPEINKKNIVPSLYRKHHPVDLRIVLNWDADRTDMDLWVIGPDGEKCFYSRQRMPDGGFMSRDFTGGFGPEEYWIRTAQKGKYKVMANFYGSRSQNRATPVSLRLELFQNYGTKEQTMQSRTMRMGQRREEVFIGEFEVK